ncbi:hypothetical protein GQ53DRAFT_726744 [Thozetella sp. PMI_491]|nr:hypothetical protein GQ53DRAFT_726744 [Thozetella sp. PMI_491]
MPKTRTVTRDRKVIVVDLGGQLLIPDQQDANRSVELTFRVGVTNRTGLHWHETQTEYVQVLQGHATITVGDHTAVFGPEDGIVTIPKFTLHQYGRADDTPEGAASKGVDMIVKEWTDPADGEKELFFRNILGIIEDRQPGILGTLFMVLSVFTVFWHHDNYPVIWQGPRFLGRGVQKWAMRSLTYTVMRLVGIAGLLVGCRGDYDEYTPAYLDAARAR